HARRLFFTMVLCTTVCGFFFLFFPTTYPRALYPLDPTDPWAAELLSIRSSDSPTNCFPSLHVALAWGIALCWSAFLQRRISKALPFVWAVLVTATTLTTKQHYLVDVPAGFVVGVLSYVVLSRTIVPNATPVWRSPAPVETLRPRDEALVQSLLTKVEAHQWRLDDIRWPTGPLPALSPVMIRLINEVIYIEEIAGFNFRLLQSANQRSDLKALYGYFADEERRHADGLRHLLRLHGAPIRPPGLGNTLVLDQFDSLDPKNHADALLIAVANPVFETFLDAGTIPFLQKHPSLKGDAFDEFVRRVCRDEAAHIALNWILSRENARRATGLRSIALLLNPSIYRGVLAIPFMALDVYALAARVGYDFRTLIPPFRRLWFLHNRYPELRSLPLWWLFRGFVVCGVAAVWTVLALQRVGLFFGSLWTTFTRLTNTAAWWLFGERLLRRRGLPLP
ncbi:MAG: phosphatase PAP2 family protein, partial [Myxococcota bacterium]